MIALFEQPVKETPVYLLNQFEGNDIYIKRDDMIPFSFGGNKVRKAYNFYQEIKNGKHDIVMTYGSGSSNHCRIIANMCCAMNIPCIVISPDENYEDTKNSALIQKFGAKIEKVPVCEVSKHIDKRMEQLRAQGLNPYFIMGGGHGNAGTQGYVDAYREIREYEKRMQVQFDYIFHASGTGTTQAGLVCGMLMSERTNQKIVGISIARNHARGFETIRESVCDYLNEKKVNINEEIITNSINFTDKYCLDGYGSYNKGIEAEIENNMKNYGIPMDTTYVGKAFWGMKEYIKSEELKEKKILFIHTGGTPLFFDYMDIDN